MSPTENSHRLTEYTTGAARKTVELRRHATLFGSVALGIQSYPTSGTVSRETIDLASV